MEFVWCSKRSDVKTLTSKRLAEKDLKKLRQNVIKDVLMSVHESRLTLIFLHQSSHTKFMKDCIHPVFR